MPERETAAEQADGRTFVERARRAQLLDAAIATIAEAGYGAATFARIADRAGVSPSLISYHFDGKDELMDRVIAHVEAAMERAISAAADGSEHYSEALRALVETQVGYFGEHAAEVRALGEIASHAGPGSPAALTLQRSREQTLHDLESMFREGQDEGHFGEFAPRAMAVTLLAALEAVPGELAARPDTDAGEHGRDLADIFERATAATAPMP